MLALSAELHFSGDLFLANSSLFMDQMVNE